MTDVINNLSDKELDLKLKKFRNIENTALADIILYLSELDKRKAYSELGYSSLFTYCTEALGYSEGSAYRRMQAARCLSVKPCIYESIKSGKLTLCAVAEIAKVKEDSVKESLLVESQGKSKREVQKITAMHLPLEKSKKEVIRAKLVEVSDSLNFVNKSLETEKNESEDKNSSANNRPAKLKANILKYNFTMEVDEDFMTLYTEAKEIIGHVPASEILKRVLKEFVGKRNTLKRKVNSNTDNQKPSRFIPKSVKIAVRNRDNNQCSFVSEDGKHCSERCGLEFDHKIPYSAGGSTDFSNLRLLCKAHNLLMAERILGKDKMQEFKLHSALK